MTDEWLAETLVMCDEQSHLETVSVNRVELQKRLEELYWHNVPCVRMNEAARKMKEYPDGVCRCGGIPQTAADGTCFYCHGKVK